MGAWPSPDSSGFRQNVDLYRLCEIGGSPPLPGGERVGVRGQTMPGRALIGHAIATIAYPWKAARRQTNRADPCGPAQCLSHKSSCPYQAAALAFGCTSRV
ncbi:hypothetical protein CHELA20_52331 [Hyphomicrobiales bacterium]|nr:hypothetical protein CHELA20_52331 [Hyphomicrobiales bacterium]